MSIHVLSNAPKVLLVDANGVVRGTLASVCRDLNVARVTQAASIGLGEQWLMKMPFGGLVLSMTEEEAALALLTDLRGGKFQSEADLPVVVLANDCTAKLIERLKKLKVRRLLLLPFKLRDVIQALEQLCVERGGNRTDAGAAKRPRAAETPPVPAPAAEDDGAQVPQESAGHTAPVATESLADAVAGIDEPEGVEAEART